MTASDWGATRLGRGPTERGPLERSDGLVGNSLVIVMLCLNGDVQRVPEEYSNAGSPFQLPSRRSWYFLFAVAAQAATSQPGYPVPQIIGPTHPSAVLPGSLHFTLDVYGANFINGSVVNWNGSARTTTFLSAHHLWAQINAADVALPTSGFITVTTNSPNGPIKSSTYAQVLVHQPTTHFSAERAAAVLNIGPPYMLAHTTGTNRVDVTGIVNVGFQTQLNNGDGTFTGAPTFAVRYPGFGGAGMGDFNGDGYMDFVFPNGLSDQTSWEQKVALGGPGAAYARGGTYTTISISPWQYLVGDFNQDGVLDVYQDAGFGNGISEIFTGNGDGIFSHGPFVAAQDNYAVLGDFNNDGKLNLISIDYVIGIGAIKMYLGNGDGTFQKPRVIKQNPSLSLVPILVSTDVNGDGNADLIYTDGNSQIHVLLGNGDGTFRNPKLTNYDATTMFYFGDFNSDGREDILSVGFGTVTLLAGNGDGTFTAGSMVSIPSLRNGGPTLVADFNGDGLLDFIGVSQPNAAYVVFFQQQ